MNVTNSVDDIVVVVGDVEPTLRSATAATGLDKAAALDSAAMPGATVEPPAETGRGTTTTVDGMTVIAEAEVVVLRSRLEPVPVGPVELVAFPKPNGPPLGVTRAPLPEA